MTPDQNKPATQPQAPAADKPATAPVAATQPYFVPDYGVSVEATSADDAAIKAKQLKGVK